MIQQMRGDGHWLEDFEKSTHQSWADFMVELAKYPDCYVMVFILDDFLFGFGYVNIENEKSIIKEFYIEPGFKDQIIRDELSVLVSEEIAVHGPAELVFDIKDLPFS
jgi:hypothetical protein